MADRDDDNAWAQQVRQNWQKGPYRDYGWESGESALPEFRDPDVHRTREEEEEARDWRRRQGGGPGTRPGSFPYDYDARRAGGMPTGEDRTRYGGGPGYEREARRPSGPHVGKGPKNYQRSNERILEDVNERLTRHGDIDATDIEVRVENGEVWLTGMVENRQQKRLAEDVADSVAGVRDVHNELRIQQPSR